MDEKVIYDILKKENPGWSESKLRAAAKDISVNPKILEAGAGGLRKAVVSLGKTFIKKPTKKQVLLGGGALGLGGLAVQGGGDSGTPDVAEKANTDLMLQLATAQSQGVDIEGVLNTPVGQQLIKTPGFNIGAIMNSGSFANMGTGGVYTGKPVTVSQYQWGSGGAKPKTTMTDVVSLTDWKNQFPIADPKALAKWKATLVSAGVVSASAGLAELKQQWEAWGQASQDAGRQGQKLTPYQLLDIQRGLWGGGGGRDYSTQYRVDLLKAENVKSMYKSARQQEAGAIVGDEAAGAFAERVAAQQMAKPTKTEYKKIKGKMTPVTTPGYGEAEAAAAAVALAKKDPLYAEFQTANVFGTALERALGVRG